jgi:hypothetical protein
MSLYEIWKLKLTGTGELNNHDNFGHGIEATLTRYKTYDEIHVLQKDQIKCEEKKYRIAKVNVEYYYEPQIATPPECKSNYRHSSFEFKLVPETEDFIPFEIDKNTYVQTNWFGYVDTTTSILRMVYDKSGNEHCFKSQNEHKKLNRTYQTFDGHGNGIQGPIQYFFNGFMCVVNSFLAGWNEQYTGIQSSNDELQITHTGRILVDDFVSYSLDLKGTVRQSATAKNNEPGVNNIEVQVFLDGLCLRNHSGTVRSTDQNVLTDPFSNKMIGDEVNGVYATFYFGLSSNNLICLAARRLQSDNLNSVKSEQVRAIAAHDACITSIAANKINYDASYEPMRGDIAISNGTVTCWV